MSILSWDLETSSLNADYGVILCAGFKTVGSGKPKVLSIADYEGKTILDKEKRLLRDVSDILLSHDVWLTWFGTYFDIPFVNSRLLYHRLPTLPTNYPHVDGWKTARNRLKLRNNRLKTVQEFLGTATEKDAVLGPIWVKAISGDEKALKYVINHCFKDICALEEVYWLLRPLIVDHPNAGLIDGRGGCSVCGETKLQKRGFHITRTRKYQRFQCQNCGAWTRGTQPVAKTSV
jgi:uncharacterized protein YprB with RNaseH-like and TPR domain